MAIFQLIQLIADFRHLLQRCQAVDAGFLHAALDLAGQPGDPNHDEFIEIAARNGQDRSRSSSG